MISIQPPLPTVPSLKLVPFTPTARASIKFLKSPGRSKDKDDYVWEVEIKDRGIFAHKLFPFIHQVSLRVRDIHALDDVENFGIDPRDYDWRKWKQSGEDADSYVESNLYADKEPCNSDDEPGN
ncbi:hypothetical protein QBC36DRAFT_315018 [Triangularia setosa]|uniref:Uncharacterized protein n=1 Tax=Triangularia setosa TaxID=2587417 RepID=A0AAN7A1W3_9PEZI|nr:hypothetical protein QBC36DRAFT_315018 [Podospora setosa]